MKNKPFSSAPMQKPLRAGASAASVGDGEDPVFGFDNPHRIGSICGFPCNQCSGGQEPDGELTMVGINGQILPQIPMLIVAEATEEDWRRDVIKNGGKGEIRHPSTTRYYYFVRPD